jgi:hypothetical protein
MVDMRNDARPLKGGVNIAYACSNKNPLFVEASYQHASGFRSFGTIFGP